MVLMLRADATTVLHQPEDFARFHCEIDAAFATVEGARAALAPVAEIESRELAWVDRDALFALGRDSAPDAATWAAAAQAMLDKAARHGWVRERRPSIKCHIVWRAGAPPTNISGEPQ